MAILQIIIKNENELAAIAKQFLAAFPDNKLFSFQGELGAGKTTFIKALCRELGVKDNMSSPSFSIVNEYSTEKGVPIYHFDLYRLKSPQEAFDIGMEEYLYSGNYCFVEWPEKGGAILPQETVRVKITVEERQRIVSVE